jgi:hypothetical protein
MRGNMADKVLRSLCIVLIETSKPDCNKDSFISWGDTFRGCLGKYSKSLSCLNVVSVMDKPYHNDATYNDAVMN